MTRPAIPADPPASRPRRCTFGTFARGRAQHLVSTQYREMCDGPEKYGLYAPTPANMRATSGLSSIHSETRWPQPTGAEQGTGADLSSSRRAHDDALNAKSPTSCAKRSGASR